MHIGSKFRVIRLEIEHGVAFHFSLAGVKRLEGVARYSWDVRVCSWIFGSVTFCIAFVIAIMAA